MAEANIDILAPKKSLIDLVDSHNNSLDGLIDQDYELGFLFDDIILVEFIDEISDGQGDAVIRGGVYIPLAHVQRTWRLARVILVGPKVKYTKAGDIVCFPDDKGIKVDNLRVAGYDDALRNCLFLNEDRFFGVCEELDDDRRIE